LTEFNVTNSNINEVFLGLTRRNLVTGVVLLGLGTLTTDLTRDDNLATGGSTTAHNSTHNVVSSNTDWSTVKKLVLKGFNVCRC
jgi:hypothetical protein